MRALGGIGLVLGLAFAGIASVKADQKVDSRYSREYRECMASGDAANGVTVGIMSCNGIEIDQQDTRLNQAYRMVMTRLNVQKKTALRTSERNWIRQRDEKCRRKSAAAEGGSLAGIIYSKCILDETIKRRIWLENYKG
jgi:uncharacterized protein YecT (DUF1311 family)